MLPSAGPRSAHGSRTTPLRSGARGESPATAHAAPTPSGPSRPRVACRPSRAERAPRRESDPDVRSNRSLILPWHPRA
jgi:hypothetical protein